MAPTKSISLRTRGERPPSSPGHRQGGSIPAYAGGETRRSSRSGVIGTVYPRIGGASFGQINR